MNELYHNARNMELSCPINFSMYKRLFSERLRNAKSGNLGELGSGRRHRVFSIP